mmetsp:Transcript_10943/g.30024  ORF Transcript_10943/g.30024 Transcript_10943/m.30024 type:complete len:205 (-) Transcript_10943:1038-1652(-)
MHSTRQLCILVSLLKLQTRSIILLPNQKVVGSHHVALKGLQNAQQLDVGDTGEELHQGLQLLVVAVCGRGRAAGLSWGGGSLRLARHELLLCLQGLLQLLLRHTQVRGARAGLCVMASRLRHSRARGRCSSNSGSSGTSVCKAGGGWAATAHLRGGLRSARHVAHRAEGAKCLALHGISGGRGCGGSVQAFSCIQGLVCFRWVA